MQRTQPCSGWLPRPPSFPGPPGRSRGKHLLGALLPVPGSTFWVRCFLPPSLQPHEGRPCHSLCGQGDPRHSCSKRGSRPERTHGPSQTQQGAHPGRQEASRDGARSAAQPPSCSGAEDCAHLAVGLGGGACAPQTSCSPLCGLDLAQPGLGPPLLDTPAKAISLIGFPRGQESPTRGPPSTWLLP